MSALPPGVVGVDLDTYIHFRYHDAVNALIGNHRYRYEVHKFRDIPELIKYLEPKGMDDFSWRPLRSLEPWRVVTGDYEATVEYPKVFVQGRGKIDRVGTDENGHCGRCHSKNLQVENHSYMWHDGDIVCQDCGGYVRMFDAG